MKLVLKKKPQEDPEVLLSLRAGASDGSVCLNAKNCETSEVATILIIHRNGAIERFRSGSANNLGFVTDDNGMVKIIN